jgi:hypothetical protein
VDFTLAPGNPDSDLIAAVSPAWVHLRRICCGKYPLTSMAGSPALLTKEIDHEQKKDNG